MEYFVDYETKSDLSLPDYGKMRHLHTPNSDIVMMTWGTPNDPAKLWLPGAPPPFQFTKSDWFIAFNAQFDRSVQNILGKKYGLPFIPLEQCVDLMAVCARFALPQSLDQVCKVLELKNQKLTTQGKALMKKICMPPFKYTRQEFLLFAQYGLQDTDAIIELAKRLPTNRLSRSEQECWIRTAKMNERGVEIDVRSATKIYQCVESYKKRRINQLRFHTNDELKTPGQVAKIRAYADKRGVYLPNLQKQTVEAALEDDTLPSSVRTVLEIRQDTASTSVKKFSKAVKLAYLKVVYDFLFYHAASTGRYSSRGLQLHNLIRKGIDDIDALLAEFFDGRIFQKNVIEEAKKLIRGIIRARHLYEYIISDFSSIEYVMALWLAGDKKHIEDFKNFICPYKTLAAELLHKPYEDITKDERQMGKPGVLGGIYGLGPFGYIDYAKGYGITATREEAEIVIYTLRKNYYLIKSLWYRLQDMVIAAIRNPGIEYKVNKVHAKVVEDKMGVRWLKIILPSKRPLWYYDPKIGQGMYGDVATHMGINSQTKQWERQELTPSRIIENTDQGASRDLLVHCEAEVAKLEIEYGEKYVHQAFSCHDELVEECHVSLLSEVTERVHKIMCTPPAWCRDLPLRAETFTSKRYKKG